MSVCPQMRWFLLWEKEPSVKWWSVSTETSKSGLFYFESRNSLTIMWTGEFIYVGLVQIFFCLLSNRDERVAVKIVRNINSFSEVARSEISVLQEINSLDDDNRLWVDFWLLYECFPSCLLIRDCVPSAPVWGCSTGSSTAVTSASCSSCSASAPSSSSDRTTSCPSAWSRSDTWPSRCSEPSAVSPVCVCVCVCVC